MKTKRPLIPPPNASFALQAAMVYGQMQVAKENHQKASIRVNSAKKL